MSPASSIAFFNGSLITSFFTTNAGNAMTMVPSDFNFFESAASESRYIFMSSAFSASRAGRSHPCFGGPRYVSATIASTGSVSQEPIFFASDTRKKISFFFEIGPMGLIRLTLAYSQSVFVFESLIAFSEISDPIMCLNPMSAASIGMVPDPQNGSRMVDELGFAPDKLIIMRASFGGNIPDRESRAGRPKSRSDQALKS